MRTLVDWEADDNGVGIGSGRPLCIPVYRGDLHLYYGLETWYGTRALLVAAAVSENVKSHESVT